MSQVQPSQQTAVGAIVNVQTHRTGNKWFVTIQPEGSQYQKNLWTSDQALAADLYGKIGQRLGFVCNVNPDQNDPSKNYWWIVGVVNADAAAAPPPPIPVQQQATTLPPQQTTIAPPQQPVIPTTPPTVTVNPPVIRITERLPEEEREARIMRQTATKVAGILISHVPSEQRTLDNVLSLSERLVAYYRQGLNGVAEEVVPANEWADHPDYQAQGLPPEF